MAHSLHRAFAEAGYDPPVPHDYGSDGPVERPGWLTEAQVGMSFHAVERYQERFASHLNLEEAKVALRYRLAHGSAVFSKERPHWLVCASEVRVPEPENHRGYLTVDDELLLPLRESRYLPNAEGRISWQRFYVVTCLWNLSVDGEDSTRHIGGGR
jgi:hypothetical protein